MGEHAVTNVRKELSQDHEDHELLLEELARSLQAKRPAAELRASWQEFEENLFDHLETEERSLFSVAATAHGLEIEQLRAEHRQIRQAVFGMAVSIELNTLKAQAIDELRAQLRSHTEHEQRSLHRWLAEDQGVLALRGVLAMRSRRERSSPRLRAAAKVEE